MRIAILTVWPYPHTGGVSTHIGLLAQALRAEGHEVVIISGRHTPGLEPVIAYETLMRELALDLTVQAANVDVVLAQDAAAAVAVREVAAWATTPICLTLQGYLADETVAAGVCAAEDHVYQYLLGLERAAVTASNAIFTVDTRLAGHARILGAKTERVIVVENAVDTDALYPATIEERQELRVRYGLPSRPVALCARRLTAKNGVRYAIEAVGLLPPDERPALLIAGDGEEREGLAGMIEAFDLSHDVALLGSVPHEVVLDLYKASDLALIPSVPVDGVEEATSLAALEAMALGLPTIASDLGGLYEIGQSGGMRLVRPADPIALATAIQGLLTDHDECVTLQARGRREAEEHHSLARWISEYVRVIRAVVDGQVPARRQEIQDDAMPEEVVRQEDGRNAGEQDVHTTKISTLSIPGRRAGRSAVATEAVQAERRYLNLSFVASHGHLTGGARVFFDHARSLAARGHHVQIVAPTARPPWLTSPLPWQRSDLSRASLQSALDGSDVIVAMHWSVLPYLRVSSAPIVHLEQGDVPLYEPATLGGRKGRDTMAAAYTQDGVVHAAVSTFTAAVLQKRFGVSATVVPNCVDTKLFHPVQKTNGRPGSEREATLLIVGDDLPFKGFELVFATVQLLRQRGWLVEVVQASPNDIAGHDFPRHRVVGATPREMAALYGAADLFVSASRYESFPLAPLEAMAAGTPVVSTDSGGVRTYAVDEENCLITQRDPEALAQAITRFLVDDDFRQRCVANGLSTASIFTADASVAALEGLLWDVADSAHHSDERSMPRVLFRNR